MNRSNNLAEATDVTIFTLLFLPSWISVCGPVSPQEIKRFSIGKL